jgi:hypothetical protein
VISTFDPSGVIGKPSIFVSIHATSLEVFACPVSIQINNASASIDVFDASTNVTSSASNTPLVTEIFSRFAVSRTPTSVFARSS